MIEQAQPVLSFVGILLQLAGALMLGGLFLQLRRYARRRRYFAIWGMSWFAFAGAAAALALRHLLLPDLAPALVAEEQSFPTKAVYFVYQLTKLLYFVLLIAGTAAYATGAKWRRYLPATVAACAAYALASVVLAADLNGVLLWQAPVAAVALCWCAARLLTLPPSRHAVGPRLAGFVFLLLAALWLAHLFAYAQSVAADDSGFYAWMVHNRNYFQVMLHMMLGCSMVVILMEHAKREVDGAHAELALAHDELRRAALLDTVTGALNRRAFAEGVGLEEARGNFGAVMMVDLDDLKGVNDNYGHSAGDALLHYLADVLRIALRPSDKVYRWGGDEFLLVLPGAEAEPARARICNVLEHSEPFGINEAKIPLKVSIGATFYASIEHLSEAIGRADMLMYEDKKSRKLRRGTGSPVA